ncbi:hypothetical protein ACSBR1_024522 [Camellia fascicularis]
MGRRWVPLISPYTFSQNSDSHSELGLSFSVTFSQPFSPASAICDDNDLAAVISVGDYNGGSPTWLPLLKIVGGLWIKCEDQGLVKFALLTPP